MTVADVFRELMLPGDVGDALLHDSMPFAAAVDQYMHESINLTELAIIADDEMMLLWK
ncbi:MAG TPA: hypothetical protein VGG75_06240 [Trebonia sp.]